MCSSDLSGTFNLKLSEPYIVISDAQIEAHEYNRKEFIKLQRCVVDGVRAIIMRPNTHEDGYAHGPSHIELLSTVVLRETLRVENGSVVDVEVEGDEDWWSRGI